MHVVILKAPFRFELAGAPDLEASPTKTPNPFSRFLASLFVYPYEILYKLHNSTEFENVYAVLLGMTKACLRKDNLALIADP